MDNQTQLFNERKELDLMGSMTEVETVGDFHKLRFEHLTSRIILIFRPANSTS